jgi:hypothetical protein
MHTSAVFTLICLNVRFLHIRSINCNDEATPGARPLTDNSSRGDRHRERRRWCDDMSEGGGRPEIDDTKVKPMRLTVRPEEERDADGTRRMSGGKGNTRGTPGGDGKRGVGHRPQATAPILDSTTSDT